eukprot:gene8556-33989_t
MLLSSAAHSLEEYEAFEPAAEEESSITGRVLSTGLVSFPLESAFVSETTTPLLPPRFSMEEDHSSDSNILSGVLPDFVHLEPFSRDAPESMIMDLQGAHSSVESKDLSIKQAFRVQNMPCTRPSPESYWSTTECPSGLMPFGHLVVNDPKNPTESVRGAADQIGWGEVIASLAGGPLGVHVTVPCSDPADLSIEAIRMMHQDLGLRWPHLQILDLAVRKGSLMLTLDIWSSVERQEDSWDTSSTVSSSYNSQDSYDVPPSSSNPLFTS